VERPSLQLRGPCRKSPPSEPTHQAEDDTGNGGASCVQAWGRWR
jgi:hypothetical protein